MNLIAFFREGEAEIPHNSARFSLLSRIQIVCILFHAPPRCNLFQ